MSYRGPRWWLIRRVRAVLAFALLVCWVGGCGESPAPSRDEPASSPAARVARPPNLVVITMDTTRADVFGAYGSELAATPRIDAAAREGVVFEQVVATNPETLPSHASIFTGRYPFSHGVRANGGFVLSNRNVTLAEHLKAQGYATGAEIAATVLRPETQITQGFDHYRGAESPGVELKQVMLRGRGLTTREIRLGSDITARGIEFAQRHRERPFFLWLHYFDAHSPYSAPPPFKGRFPGRPDRDEVAYQDHQIGRFLAALEQLGLRETTLVSLSSDHGEGFDEHGESSHGYLVYQSTMRIPWILWGLDSLPRGHRVRSLARAIDIAPTALDLIGQPGLSEAEGVSLATWRTAGEATPGLTAYGEATYMNAIFGLPPLRMLRDGKWKYIHKVNPELYDLEADPAEQVNLAAEQPAVAGRLRGDLEALLRSVGPAPDDATTELAAAAAAQLSALGYVVSDGEVRIEDEIESLELSGDDVNDKMPDVELMLRATAQNRAGNHADALATIRPAWERNPANVAIVREQAGALAGLGRAEEAVVLLESLRERRPQDVEVVRALADTFDGAGERESAIDAFDDLLALSPCDEAALRSLNRLLNAVGQYARLVSTLAAAVDRCPGVVSNTNNYAWALATLPEPELRDGERAIVHARAALAGLEVADVAYLDTLAAAQAEAGHFDDAVATLDEALRSQPNSGLRTILRQHREEFGAGRPVRDPAPE